MGVGTALALVAGWFALSHIAVCYFNNISSGDGDEKTTPLLSDSDRRNSTTANNNNNKGETVYICCAQIGIFSAWIGINLENDTLDHMLPILGVLVISLAALTAIVYCVPEDTYIATAEQDELTFPRSKRPPAATFQDYDVFVSSSEQATAFLQVQIV